MTNKSGFTLMEVLIAVLIISVIVTGMLSISSKENRLIKQSLRYTELSNQISLFIYNLKVEKEKKDINLYDYIKNFKINDEYKKEYKKNIHYVSKMIKSYGDQTEKKSKDKNTFKIYQESFSDDSGATIRVYRLSRE